MKLLFDQNLSYRLVDSLHDLFPESAHVRSVGLATATDAEVWGFAGANGYVIVTKDWDFNQLAFLHGPPPKVVWIQLGNCTTQDVDGLLASRHPDVIAFDADESASLLILP